MSCTERVLSKFRRNERVWSMKIIIMVCLKHRVTRMHTMLHPNFWFYTNILSFHNMGQKLHSINKMLRRKIVHKCVYLHVTKSYNTVLYLYSVSIGVTYGAFWCASSHMSWIFTLWLRRLWWDCLVSARLLPITLCPKQWHVDHWWVLGLKDNTDVVSLLKVTGNVEHRVHDNHKAKLGMTIAPTPPRY